MHADGPADRKCVDNKVWLQPDQAITHKQQALGATYSTVAEAWCTQTQAVTSVGGRAQSHAESEVVERLDRLLMLKGHDIQGCTGAPSSDHAKTRNQGRCVPHVRRTKV